VSSAAAPDGLSVIDTSDTAADLVWSPVTGAATYRVSRAGADGGTFQTIGDVAGPSFGDSGLTPQTTYRWHVSAIANGAEGPASTDTTATTRATPAPCDSPGSCPVSK
jgi:poly(3-hydroxybutyrate) depolymerase